MQELGHISENLINLIPSKEKKPRIAYRLQNLIRYLNGDHKNKDRK